MVILSLTAFQLNWSAPDKHGLIAESLGCRRNSTLLVFEIQHDGSVLCPDGAVCSIQEAAQQLPRWTDKFQNRTPPIQVILGIQANSDTLLLILKPLLDAAKDLGVEHAVFAATDQGDIRIIQRF